MNQSPLLSTRGPLPESPAGPAGIRGEVVMVRIDELRVADSPRAQGIDREHVRLLAEVGGGLPPITVHHETMRVIDGMHRLAAARLTGASEIAVTFFHGGIEEAFLHAVRANLAHGLPLTLSDRRAAAVRLARAHPAMTDRMIARTVGLAPGTVGSVRAALGDEPAVGHRVGADGRLRPMTSVEGRITAGRLMAQFPEASLRDIARRAGISLGTAHDVRKRVMAGEDPVPPPRGAKARGRDAAGAAGAETTVAADVAVVGRGVEADARPRATDVRVDVQHVIDVLRRDPALRYSDFGRSLVRWLDQSLAAPEQWRKAAGMLPPHCVENVAKAARECARRWAVVAEEMSTDTAGAD